MRAEPRSLARYGSSADDAVVVQLRDSEDYSSDACGYHVRTFLLFGSCCIVMGIYAIFFVPETKGVPLESIHLLFEGNIIAGCVKDTFPSTSRAKKIGNTHYADEVEDIDGGAPKKNRSVEHVETA